MALAEALPSSWEVVFKTNAPEWLFRKELARPYMHVASPLDIHPVHTTSYFIDPLGTFQHTQAKLQGLEDLVQNEVAWLRKSKVDVVIADIPPLAIHAAKCAGLPAFGVSNFTWDWIFKPLLDGISGKQVIATMRNMTAQATANFRLPFSTPETFPGGSIESPLLVRSVRMSREEARKHYGLTVGTTYVLVTFGGIEGPVKSLAPLMDFQPLQFVSVAKESGNGPPLEQGLFRHPEITNLWILRRDDLYHPDLVNAIDAVVTKPGYGILSECMATATPIILDARDDFREFMAVRATAERYPQMAIVDNAQMKRLDLGDPLAKVLNSPAQPWEGGLNGAEFVAGIIAGHFH